MRIILKLFGYLVGLALFAAGACVVAFAAAAVLVQAYPEAAKAGEIGKLPIQDLLLAIWTNAVHWQLGVGAGLAVLGLLIARPPFSISRAAKADERERSLDDVVLDLTDPVSDVRLAAAEALTAGLDPSTIPALINALKDSVAKVRGQAAEALEAMTGLTFDFVDVGSQGMRRKSVSRWTSWWQEHRDSILAGTDPREFGVPEEDGEPEELDGDYGGGALRRAQDAAVVSLSNGGGAAFPAEAPPAAVSDFGELGRAVGRQARPTPRPGSTPAGPGDDDTGDGRNVSLGAIARKRRKSSSMEAVKQQAIEAAGKGPPAPAAATPAAARAAADAGLAVPAAPGEPSDDELPVIDLDEEDLPPLEP